MPHYDYTCPTNGETVEVYHSMSEMLKTWGELCQKAERELGKTPADAPIERVMSGGIAMISGKGAPSMSLPVSGGHTCCGGGCHQH